MLAIGFVLGVALMGFEMVASRFLYPYYGSGIEVWASLISTVLLALMAGYFIGGNWPTARREAKCWASR